MLVSIIIPAQQWDSFLEATLSSIAGQVLSSGVEVETIIALKGQVPVQLPEGVRVVPNPSGTIPDGLNLAVGAALGEIVARVDARCVLGSQHVARVVRRLQDPTIGCVGGAALALDRGRFGSAYAVAFNSPLLGPTRFRYSRRSGPTDAAYLGAWSRGELVELGGFDSRLLRNQDNELADRVRAAGLTVWYDADMVVGYWNNRGWLDALAHHREFGRWRMIQRSHGQRALTPRHVLALAALTASALGGLATLRSRRRLSIAARAGTCGYALAAGAGWFSASRLRRSRSDIDGPHFDPIGVVLAPAVAASLDGAWIFGLLQGLVETRLR